VLEGGEEEGYNLGNGRAVDVYHFGSKIWLGSVEEYLGALVDDD